MIRRFGAPSPGLALLLALGSSGCAAMKGSAVMLKAQQSLGAAQADGAEDAVYYWTLASSYMEKAREEWGHSDYEPAEALAHKAEEYAAKAAELARAQRIANPDIEGDEALPEQGVHKEEQPDLPDPDRVDEDFLDPEDDQ